jgi:4-carboxymuconolactone decarboxylase
MRRLVALVALSTAAAGALAESRFPVLTEGQLDSEQTAYVHDLLAGPRGQADRSSPDAVRRMLEGGPFNAWARSPQLGERLQKLGEYIRFQSSLPRRLNEFAILITARHWGSQYEWYAHHPLAMAAGLDPQVAEQLRLNRRPQGMKEDEALVYEFCTELHRQHQVRDDTFEKAVAMFGERGVVDLIGVSGYYTAVSMTLNVARVPIPNAGPLPLPDAK